MNRGKDYVQVHLAADERQLIDEAAKAARLPRSTWMRLVCLEAAQKGAKVNIVRET
jgi:uncharacterized protein (DUF1778 family)